MLQAYGSSVSDGRTLQVFHVDIAKVDRDVAYVAIAIHIYWKHLFPMFHLFF
jgi:hypothetical protein